MTANPDIGEWDEEQMLRRLADSGDRSTDLLPARDEAADAPPLDSMLRGLRLLHRASDAVAGVSSISAEEPGPPLPPRYQLVARLGSGGFGTVYHAVDLELHRDVAIKLPNADVLLTRRAMQRFFREAQHAACLDHPNIIPILSTDFSAGLPLLVYPYCSGPTLSAWRAQREAPVAPRTAAQIVRLLAEAIHHAHSRGILHRDLKPANILLDPAETSSREHVFFDGDKALIPKIVDFGIAKSLEQSDEATHTGAILGTAEYMSPEQAAGKTAEIGTHSDVYALGAILYELLSGRPPIRGATPAETRMRVLRDRPMPLRSQRKDVPRPLEAIAQHCLHADYRKRYSSAQALAQDLTSYLKDRQVSVQHLSWLPRLRLWALRHPQRAGLAAVLFSLLLLVLAGLGLHYRGMNALLKQLAAANTDLAASVVHATQQETLAVKTAKQLRHELYTTDLKLAADALMHNNLAAYNLHLQPYSGADPEAIARDPAWRYLWKSGNCAVTLVHRFPKAAYVVELSPDGKWLAAAGADAEVVIYQTDNLELAAKWNTNQQEVNSVAFSPGGSWLATSGDDQTICIWDWQQQRELCRIVAHSDQVYEAQFLDERTIISGGIARELRFWSIPDGKLIGELRGHEDKIHSMALSPGRDLLVTTSRDDTCRIWDLATREPVRVIKLTSPTRSVTFALQGKAILYGADDGTVALHSVVPDSTRRESHYSRSHSRIDHVAVNSQGTSAALGSFDGGIQILNTLIPNDIEPQLVPAEQNRWTAHEGRVFSQTFSVDGRYLFSAGSDGCVQRWDLNSLERIAQRRFIDDPVYQDYAQLPYALLPQTQQIAAVHAQQLYTYDLKFHHGQLWTTFESTPLKIAASPTDNMIFASFADGSLEAWSGKPEGATRLWKVTSEHERPRGALYAPLGMPALVTGGSTPNPIRRLDSRTGEVTAEYHFPPDTAASLEPSTVSAIATSPDLQYLAAGVSRDIFLWEGPGAGTVLGSHTSTVMHLDVHPTRPLLVSASGDRSIRLWDLQHRKLLATLRGHANNVLSVHFTPDGTGLVSSGADGTIKLWQLDPPRALFDLARSTRDSERLELAPHYGTGLMVGLRGNGRVYSLPLRMPDPPTQAAPGR